MSDSSIGAPASLGASSSTPVNSPAPSRAGVATRPTDLTAPGLVAENNDEKDGFGPAVVIGGQSPPSVFSVYTANGAEAEQLPTLRVAAPTVGLSSEVPSSTLYERLGRIIYQVQLAFRGGGLGSAYTLGYRLLV